MGRLDDKVALVTGGASGIGAATAMALAREGSRAVVVADRDTEGGTRVASAIETGGGRAAFMPLDVVDEARWIEVVAETLSRFGRLDVAVNNAGMPSRLAIDETSVEHWDRVQAVNSRGVFLGTKYCARAMRDSGGGSIINISSIYGMIGSPTGGAYHASKGAVRAFTKVAAAQYAAHRIRVNSVHPGFIDTAMTADTHGDPVERARRLALTPLGTMGTPEDLAWGCVYLASDESRYMTGAELVIDGGVTSQ